MSLPTRVLCSLARACVRPSVVKRSSAQKRQRIRRLERLESRIALDAKFNFGGSTLTLNQFTESQAESVTLQTSGNALVVRLAEGTFSGTSANGASLVNPSTLRLNASAVARLTNININDGAPNSGADPMVRLGNLDLPNVSVALNGTGNFVQLGGRTATLDAFFANTTSGNIFGSLGIDDDGSINVTTLRNLNFGGAGELTSDGSTIDLTVRQFFTGSGSIVSTPDVGDGGNIKISTTGGANFVGTIDASGADGSSASGQMAATVGGTGGNITISQASIASSPLQLGTIVTEGGEGGRDDTSAGRAAAAGGDGGGVTITVNGDEELIASKVSADGGDGGLRSRRSLSAGGGGTAGNISLTAGRIDIDNVFAQGGLGGIATSGGNAGAGGGGGAITLVATSRGGRGLDVGTLSADGGQGGNASGSGTAGAGGDAGNLSLTSSSAAIVGQSLRAGGGGGGSAQSGRGGNGGSGNSIGLSSGVNTSLQFINSAGGNGGISQLGRGGNGGSGGGVTVSSTRGLSLREIQTSGGIGASGNTGGNGGTAGNATLNASRGVLRIRTALAEGGRGQNNGGDGGTLTLTGARESFGRLSVQGGDGVSGIDGDDGSIA